MGNSEVGHTNIGAGRIVYQSLTRINKAIEDGSFFKKEALLNAIKQVKEKDSALHLFGLLSDGGVHSHIEHLFALLKLAKDEGVKEVYVHGFLDGRDVGPKTAIGYIEQTEAEMKSLGIGKFASISGRYYAMDRDKRWERVQLPSVVEAAYEKKNTDEFVEAALKLLNNAQPGGRIQDNGAMVFFNFRRDRAIQLSKCFANATFSEVKLHPKQGNYFVQMTPYSEEVYGDIAFASVDLHNTIGEVLASHNKKQLRIAETEKFPHVTYFMNGGREEEFEGE